MILVYIISTDKKVDLILLVFLGKFRNYCQNNRRFIIFLIITCVAVIIATGAVIVHYASLPGNVKSCNVRL